MKGRKSAAPSAWHAELHWVGAAASAMVVGVGTVQKDPTPPAWDHQIPAVSLVSYCVELG